MARLKEAQCALHRRKARSRITLSSVNFAPGGQTEETMSLLSFSIQRNHQLTSVIGRYGDPIVLVEQAQPQSTLSQRGLYYNRDNIS